MKHARPCQHSRVIKTKRGLKRIMINPGIVKKRKKNYGYWTGERWEPLVKEGKKYVNPITLRGQTDQPELPESARHSGLQRLKARPLGPEKWVRLDPSTNRPVGKIGPVISPESIRLEQLKFEERELAKEMENKRIADLKRNLKKGFSSTGTN